MISKHSESTSLNTLASFRLKYDAEFLLANLELRIPGASHPVGGLFVLGSSDQLRFTVLSQQSRAIYLAKSLFASGRASEGTKIGVVGGGVGGVTVAYALADLGADVTLYESSKQLCRTFANSHHRLLHPHVYDWPLSHYRNHKANLPFLSWEFDKASIVASRIASEFESLNSRLKNPVKIETGMTIQDRNDDILSYSEDDGGYLLREPDGKPKYYQHVVFAVGPGNDRRDGHGGYWDSDSIGKETSSRRAIYVIGAGDGGIIDCLRARIKDYNEQLLFTSFFQEWNPRERSRVEQEIRTFETRVRRLYAPEEVERFYLNLKAPKATDWVQQRLRSDTRLVLIEGTSVPYTARTTALNRFLFSRLQACKDNHIQAQTGAQVDFENLEAEVVRFDNQSDTLREDDVIAVRVGPSSALRKFSETVAKHAETLLTPKSDLDIFGVFDPDIPAKEPASFAPASSRWEHDSYSIDDILTTRYARYDEETGAILTEHERRGSGYDIGDEYFDRRPLTVAEAVGLHNKVLLVGEYGSGKTQVLERLTSEASTAWKSGSESTLFGKSEVWTHKGLKSPVAVRLSAVQLVGTDWYKKSDSDPLSVIQKYASACDVVRFIDEIKSRGCLLLVDGFEDLPGPVSGREVSVGDFCSAIQRVFNDFDQLAIVHSVVVTSSHEVRVGQQSADAPCASVLSKFQRFSIAPTGAETRRQLLNAYESENGVSIKERFNQLAIQSKKVIDRGDITAGILRQAFAVISNTPSDESVYLDSLKLHARLIEEYFDCHVGGYCNHISDEFGDAVLWLRKLLSHKYFCDPWSRHLVIPSSDLSRYPAFRDYCLKSEKLRAVGDGKFVVAELSIQDLLVSLGFIAGEHDGRELTGLSDALIGFVSGLRDTSESLGRQQLWLEPVLQAVRIGYSEKDRGAANELVSILTRERHHAAYAIAACLVEEAFSSSSMHDTDIDARIRKKGVKSYLEATNGLSPRERKRFGEAVYRLGVRRAGVGVGDDVLPDIEWVSVDGGETVCGATAKDANAYKAAGAILPDDELSTTKTFDQFEISKYPITKLQYSLFVEDTVSGYYSEQFWSGLKRPDDGCRALSEHGTWNEPANCLSWDEAEAFCRWLSEHTGHLVALPSDYEWEHAARQGRPDSLYASGDELEFGAANCHEEGLASISAVGMYPKSDSAKGISDLCGNVFEWCSTDYGSKTYKVVKGGSYNHDRLRARVALRGKKKRSERHPYMGFRVVRKLSRSADKRNTVAIVGTGFSGIATAIRLILLSESPLNLLLLERSEENMFGGVAYGANNEGAWEYYFNLQAGRVSLYRESRLDFVEWLNATERKEGWPKHVKRETFGPSSEVPRCVYGMYLRDRLQEALQLAKGRVVCRIARVDAYALDDSQRSILGQHAAGKTKVNADHIIICSGNLQSQHPPAVTEECKKSSQYVGSLYSAAARDALKHIPKNADVLVIGTHLSACDAVMHLCSSIGPRAGDGIKVTLTSRSGYQHKRYDDLHTHEALRVGKPAFTGKKLRDHKHLQKLACAEFSKARAKLHEQGVSDLVSAERVLKAWERHLPEFLRSLPNELCKAAISTMRSRVTAERVGVVGSIYDEIERCKNAGRVTIKQGQLCSIVPVHSDGVYEVAWEGDPVVKHFDYIVNCSGRELDYSKISDPLWRSMIDSGVATIESKTGVGVDVDWQGRLVSGANNVSERVSVVGPMREGCELLRHGRLGSFTFTIGPLKNQALECAVDVLRRLQGIEITTLMHEQMRAPFVVSRRGAGAWDSEFCKHVIDIATVAALQQIDVRDSGSMGRKDFLRSVGKKRLFTTTVQCCYERVIARNTEQREAVSVKRERVLRDMVAVASDTFRLSLEEAERFVELVFACIDSGVLSHLTRLDTVEPKRQFA